jgi:glycerophosphoryl diester phosphodiesterase
MHMPRTPAWLTAWEYAHRGLHSAGVPENSRAAAEAAIEAGMGIECDIQMSRDNIPLVFHDWELDRLTDEMGSVDARPAEELCRIGLMKTTQTIWRLSDLLELVAGRVPILVEVKSRAGVPPFRFLEAIGAELADYPGMVAVMSFDPRVGDWFAGVHPSIVRGLVCTDTLDDDYKSAWRMPGGLEQAKAQFLAIDQRDIPNVLSDLWREAGRPLLTWTVRSPAVREWALRNADALIAEGAGLV